MSPVRLVLLYPDIPQNLGGVLRLGACMGTEVHVIEPCGFPLDHARMKRAGMDYIQHVTLITHKSWEHFLIHRATHQGRLILAETDGRTSLYNTQFQPHDYLLFGSEGAGTPRELYSQMDDTLHIEMRRGMRSLNIVTSAAITLSEAHRQLRWAL